MELMLVDALLSHCKDHATLITELGSWSLGAEKVPTPENLEILRLILRELATRNEKTQTEKLSQVVTALALNNCLPLLAILRDGILPLRDITRVARTVCVVLRHCAEIVGNQVAVPVSQAAIRVLGTRGSASQKEEPAGTEHLQTFVAHGESAPHSKHKDISVEEAIEVLGAVVPTLQRLSGCSNELEQVVKATVYALKEGTDETANLICARLLPSLGSYRKSLNMLWGPLITDKEKMYVDDGICLSRRLLVLSALSDHLFITDSKDRPLKSWCCSIFWTLVQGGLCSPDSLTRKRAVYLLKKVIDWCQETGEEMACRTDCCRDGDPALFFWSTWKIEAILLFWENYLLVVETLEGNQIHVIKPVLPKLNVIIESSVSENKDSWLFHPSWHLCIYKRMFESENKTLAKEGVLHFLDMYTAKSLPESPSCSEFIIGPLMDAMSESSMYSRSSDQLIGECPILATKFQKFLTKFVSSLPQENRGLILLKFIKKMTSRHWSAVPILFMAKALADIPAKKIWGADGLLLLREVLQCTMTTHQVLLRGAAQCFFLQSAIKLTDTEKVSLSDISSFLISLRADESLDRGSKLWKEVCIWFKEKAAAFKKDSVFEFTGCLQISALSMYTKCLVEDYLTVPGSKDEHELMPDWYESRLVATMVLLAADVELMSSSEINIAISETADLNLLFTPLLTCLSKLGTNAYMPILKTDKILQLLLKILQICSSKSLQNETDGLLTIIWNLITTTTSSIFEFIVRKLSGELKTIADLDRCDLYLAIISKFVNLSLRFNWKNSSSILKFIYYLTVASAENLQDLSTKKDENLEQQIQKIVSIACLASVCGIASYSSQFQEDSYNYISVLCRYVSSMQLNVSLSKPIACEERLLEETTSQGWGKIVARYLHDQWVCFHFVLHKHKSSLSTSNTKNLEFASLIFSSPASSLQSALDVLSVIPSSEVLPVFCCMKLLVPKVLDSSELLAVDCINTAWKIVLSSCNTQLVFWPTLQVFVEFAFSNEVLSGASHTKGQLYFRIKEMIQEMVEMSISKTGVFNVLVSYCCQSWTDYSKKASITDDGLLHAKCYMEILTEACVFGTVCRRDQRLIQDTHAFIESLGKDCASNIAVISTNRDEHQVRICATVFFSSLDESNALHTQFLQGLVIHLLDKDIIVSKTKTRYYGNSLHHRLKNRLWQMLLILIPKLDQNFLSEIIDRIFQAGFSNNQASVKYLIEWAIILILHAHPIFLSKFWNCFGNTEEKLKTSICTFLSVLPHFDVVIANIPDKGSSLKKALVTALQWCFNHNFSVRLYALIALKKLWAMCKQQCIHEFDELALVIESSLDLVENIQGTGNARKNWLRIQNHFFFSTFHPLEDYSIETIFYTLPSLSELIEDEWISPHKFFRYTSNSWQSSLPLNNPRPMNVDLMSSDWLQKDTGSDLCDTINETEWTDIQKKIIPWKNSIPDFDLEMAVQNRAAKLGKSNGSLIVVASLIDKPTNLGGLCRTCEIFGASALVVDSLHHVNDKQFQYLSVTAEQWLPLTEVKPTQLLDYLQLKKNNGYTIIGVEQTAKSFDLTEYCFPEKSLLLLGNEREGIPANLIQHLDVCVEIPQQGIIRSLNVHVSGAVLIWEYTRQQILKQKDCGK
ncbi:probable methyltransferase TARBP1 isoform X2 [Xenopus laevis]|uniref:tRNA (guanosine(18)-2'-O)-methyltransferase TARBP1 n=1 Tax=Xenopus laevis TaxID=8355 RepID=A0A8J1KN43_XENLA|nr:probable methyltransferase TARBP1 isoform X2 [Xenopus laevis]